MEVLVIIVYFLMGTVLAGLGKRFFNWFDGFKPSLLIAFIVFYPIPIAIYMVFVPLLSLVMLIAWPFWTVFSLASGKGHWNVIKTIMEFAKAPLEEYHDPRLPLTSPRTLEEIKLEEASMLGIEDSIEFKTEFEE